MRLVLAGKAVVERDRGRLHSITTTFPLPSVVRMLYYIVRGRKRVPLTKKNVLLRDGYRCAYCCGLGDRLTMTVDHIVPRRAGGRSTWTNLAAACGPCNGRKRDRTPAEANMPLRIKPYEPRYIPFLVVRRHTAPDEWSSYLTLYSVSIDERVG